MALLTSAITAALVSALFHVLTGERRIAAENVIQERKNWRDKIRGMALEAHEISVNPDRAEAEVLKLPAKFSLLVNPHDVQDYEILALITEANIIRSEEFNQRVALLLKHDWERAKYEANIWRWIWYRPPGRVSFDHFKPGVKHKYFHARWNHR